MKARGMAIQGGLALAGLVAAYVTWQRPKEAQRADSVLVLSATKQSLEKVRFDDGTRFIEVQRVAAPEPRLWVSLGFLEGKRPALDAGVPGLTDPDAGVSRMPAAPPPAPPPDRTLLASERADTLIGRFIPFEATRALGRLSKEKLEELGFGGTERTLQVTVAGQTHRFRVAKPERGLIGSYVEDEETRDVYLVQSSIFTELDPASTLLVDRRLHAFRQSDFDAFTVSAGGRSVGFVQKDANVPATAKVARASQPDKPDEMAKNWHDKIWSRLVVTEVLGKGELPKAGAPKVGLRLEYGAGGKDKGWLELGVDPAKGLWARSENTASWVGLHQGAEEVLEEARRLLE